MAGDGEVEVGCDASGAVGFDAEEFGERACGDAGGPDDGTSGEVGAVEEG
jgi:hypothetical protein